MVHEKQSVEEGIDVSEVRCQYCQRIFKSSRGKSIHERTCRERGVERREHGSRDRLSNTRGEQEGRIIHKESYNPPDAQGGRVETGPQIEKSDAMLISLPPNEMKKAISQMDEERRRWESERRRFLEQTDDFLSDDRVTESSGISVGPAEGRSEHEDGHLSRIKISAELENIRNELESKVDIHAFEGLSRTRNEITRQLNELDENVDVLTNVLGEFSAKTMEDLEALGARLDAKADKGSIKPIKEAIAGLERKIEGLMTETGHQEELDISKIPPAILELVYQTTLNDLAHALIDTLGEKDANKAIKDALEEVRARTSGSELFLYEYPRWRISGLATSIRRGLISAKQVQMTYEEILRHLKEYVPHYNPKSFKALIKVKSQEFAVEGTSRLAGEMDDMKRELQSLRDMISKMSEDLGEKISHLESKLTGSKKEIEPGEEIKLHPTSSSMDTNLSQEPGSNHLDDDTEDATKVVLELITTGYNTRTKIKKKTNLGRKKIDLALENLLREGKIEEKKRGKASVYSVCLKEGGS